MPYEIDSDGADNYASLEELQVQFHREVEANKRAAAETAYALAVRYRGEDVNGTRRFDIAGIWARRAIELLDSLPSDTIDQVASTRWMVSGVPIPDLLHSRVVRQRLADIVAQ
ncbi:MAG TPA: hypothetical protein VFW65_40540 [Pseudonocardiaceae bacterium]|nr:hypothetical protein [Pseudonocardiaceae bacterium]